MDRQQNTKLEQENDRLLAELYTLRKQFDTFLKILPHTLTLMDKDGNYILDYSGFMPSSHRLNALNSHENKNIKDIYPPNLAQERLKYLQLAIEAQEPVDYSFKRYHPKFREDRWYRVDILPVEKDQAIVAVTDQTLQAKTEQDLRKRLSEAQQNLEKEKVALKKLKQEYIDYADQVFLSRIQEIIDG